MARLQITLAIVAAGGLLIAAGTSGARAYLSGLAGSIALAAVARPLAPPWLRRGHLNAVGGCLCAFGAIFAVTVVAAITGVAWLTTGASAAAALALMACGVSVARVLAEQAAFTARGISQTLAARRRRTADRPPSRPGSPP